MNKLPQSTLIFILLCMYATASMGQQRTVVSQYMYNGMVLNPAYAGSTNQFNASIMHRDQWVNIDGAPSFQTFTAHTPMFHNNIGVGLLVTRDVIGAHVEYGFYTSYAYKIRLSRGYLAGGIQGGFNNRKDDFSRLRIIHENDEYLSGVIRKFNPNFGLGVYYYNKKMYVGGSIPYLIKSRTIDVDLKDLISSESKSSRYYYITAGMVFKLNDHMNLLPSTLIRYADNQPLGIDLNCNIIFDEVVYAGLSYRSGESTTLITQLVLNKNFRLGYAYDLIVSSQGQLTNGTHEIMLNYRIDIKALSKDPLCPVYY